MHFNFDIVKDGFCCFLLSNGLFLNLTDMKLHYGDLTDSTCLVKIINEVKPTEIYNLGAQSHVKVSYSPHHGLPGCVPAVLCILLVFAAFQFRNTTTGPIVNISLDSYPNEYPNVDFFFKDMISVVE